jgi:4-hydroxybenzoate polyprenyltransferase/phosphoglycolate phosphatase-like HAD superfamily hydrolase
MIAERLDDAQGIGVGADAAVLVVDLDGTLLRSDMLHETFWAALARQWWAPLAALRALADAGKPGLKRRLAELGPVDPGRLPYNDEVLALVRRWRAQGGRTALVSAADAGLAGRVAAHLGLFDEVHGTTPGHNLKGKAKADFLAERFGAGRYVYVGDAAADLPVWAGAAEAVTVTPSARLRARVAATMAAAGDRPVTHLPATAQAARTWLRALRPHQWAKNLLVFLPMLAAHRLDAVTLGQSALAFVAFSLIASAIYLLNDLLDLDADRAHPRKRTRPFAAGALPLAQGGLAAPALLVAGLGCAALLGPGFLGVMLGYVVVTSAYSLSLKRRLVIDICVLAGLYTLRIFAGGAATGIPLSVWLLAFSIFLFFSLAAVKRQAELVDGAAAGRSGAHGRGYQVEDLPIVSGMAIASGYVSVLVMALYLTSPEVKSLYAAPQLLWGICLVLLYWISRVVMLTHRGRMHDDPVVFALRDPVSRLCLLLVAGFAVSGVLL